MFIVALLIITKNWRITSMSLNKWTMIHPHNGTPPNNKKGATTHTHTTQTNLKCLHRVQGADSKGHPGHKSIYVTSWKGQSFRQKKDQQLTETGESDDYREAGSNCSVGGTSVSYLDCGGGYVTVCICQKSWNCPLKRVSLTVYVSYTSIHLKQRNQKWALRS